MFWVDVYGVWSSAVGQMNMLHRNCRPNKYGCQKWTVGQITTSSWSVGQTTTFHFRTNNNPMCRSNKNSPFERTDLHEKMSSVIVMIPQISFTSNTIPLSSALFFDLFWNLCLCLPCNRHAQPNVASQCFCASKLRCPNVVKTTCFKKTKMTVPIFFVQAVHLPKKRNPS